MGHWILYSVTPVFCKRCTHEVTIEEKYLMFKAFYCRACMNTIENDPDYQFIFDRMDIYPVKRLKNFWKLENIEN